MDVFEQAKNVRLQDVVSTYYENPDRHGKLKCPFHNEKTASFSIKNERFKCFGCNVSGDSIEFVGLLFNLQPLESARKICHNFGLTYDDDFKKNNFSPTLSAGKLLEDKAEELDTLLNVFYSNCSILYRFYKDIFDEYKKSGFDCKDIDWMFVNKSLQFFDGITEEFIEADLREKVKIMQTATRRYVEVIEGVRRCINS